MQSDFDGWYKHCVDFHSRYSSSSRSSNRGQENVPQTTERESLYQAEPKEAWKESRQQHQQQLQPASTLPLGAKLTGNKEADDDIMAFYKAKEELLRRSGGGGSTQAKG